jgi:general secretion pathway protein G
MLCPPVPTSPQTPFDMPLQLGLPPDDVFDGEADEGLAIHRAPARRRRRHRGMSLLEIMVVITLIGLVTAAVGVSVMGALQDGQVDTARSQAFELEKAVDTYRLRRGSYPTNAQGLTALTETGKGRAVLDRMPIDQWGKPYAYVMPGQKNPRGVDIVSAGPDGQLDTSDDVGNWHDS